MGTNSGNNLGVVKVGYYSSIFLTLITLITFGFAMTAIPPSGPYCPGNCMDYPFSDILNYYPRDYYWMYFAIIQLIGFLIFMISIHFIAPIEKKIYSFISLSFTIIVCVVLLANYFVQFAVIPISVMKGETEGIALLTQYNGHGIFIALEELGFFLMSLAFIFLTPVFSKQIKLERAIRWILPIPFFVILAAFVFYSIKYGIDRSYLFEVAAITVNWLILIILGILFAIFYKRQLKNSKD